jgi:hypothetical protein
MPRPDDTDPADRHARELRRARPHRPHLDPPLGGRIMRVERLRGEAAAMVPAARPSDAPRDGIPSGFAPDDGGLPADASVLLELATAPVKRMARIVYSSNAAFVLELDARDPVDPSRPLRAVYKPTRGERPLWDFPHRTLHFREVATYLVAAALELSLVPPTTLRDGPLGAGSAQLFVDALDRELTAEEDAALDPLLRDLAVLDVLVNNADRKQAHLLVTSDAGLRGIDHGLSFLPYPRQRTVLIDLGGSPLPEPVLQRVRDLAGDDSRRSLLRDCLAPLLDDEELNALGGRLEEVAATGRYPVLDPWDGRPFEWW